MNHNIKHKTTQLGAKKIVEHNLHTENNNHLEDRIEEMKLL